MLTILHGEDTQSSYAELQNILQKYKDIPKVRLTPEDNKNFSEVLLAQNMFEPQQVVIAQNILSSKRFKSSDLKKLPQENTLVFWETQQLIVLPIL